MKSQLLFKKLAEERVNRALRTIKLIGDLGNVNKYNYTQNDVQKITHALESAISDMRLRLEALPIPEPTKFVLAQTTNPQLRVVKIQLKEGKE